LQKKKRSLKRFVRHNLRKAEGALELKSDEFRQKTNFLINFMTVYIEHSDTIEDIRTIQFLRSLESLESYCNTFCKWMDKNEKGNDVVQKKLLSVEYVEYVVERIKEQSRFPNYGIYLLMKFIVLPVIRALQSFFIKIQSMRFILLPVLCIVVGCLCYYLLKSGMIYEYIFPEGPQKTIVLGQADELFLNPSYLSLVSLVLNQFHLKLFLSPLVNVLLIYFYCILFSILFLFFLGPY
jgi:hypothetical protein